MDVKELFDFGHLKNRSEIIKEITQTLGKLALKDLQYFKRIIDAYLETK